MTTAEGPIRIALPRRTLLAVSVSLAALMAACGGSGAATSQVNSSAPSSATTSSASSATSSAVSPGQADFTLGTAATKVGMTGDATDPNGAHFVPAAVSVHVGDIVEWDYDPAAFVPHNIVFSDAPSLSNRLGLGAKPNGTPGAGTWQVRFTLAGQYSYVCTFHPGMTGTVTVG